MFWRLALVLLLMLAAGVAARQWRLHLDVQRGHTLYREGVLRARLAGDDSALPGLATRCSNCHEPNAQGAFAPVLNAATLTQAQARRGGPPSHYDEASLCKLLREGIDPAWVQIPRVMPRYEIDDQDCKALWRYLTRR